jgi:glucose/arabinose dehydrogenase
MEQPVYYWDPVIAPSGAVLYTGNLFPQWKGNLLIGSLQPGQLVRLEMTAGRVSNEHRYGGELGARIRDVQQAPDGAIYLITDENNGRVLRIEPAK